MALVSCRNSSRETPTAAETCGFQAHGFRTTPPSKPDQSLATVSPEGFLKTMDSASLRMEVSAKKMQGKQEVMLLCL